MGPNSLSNLSSFEVETSNGVLVVLILWMLCVGIIHLIHEYADRVEEGTGIGRWLAALRSLYAEDKPELSLITFIAALWLRTVVLWWARHAQNHGWVPGFFKTSGDGFLLSTTGVMIFALICWNRHVFPWRLPRIAWAMMLLASLAFSLFFAM